MPGGRQGGAGASGGVRRAAARAQAAAPGHLAWQGGCPAALGPCRCRCRQAASIHFNVTTPPHTLFRPWLQARSLLALAVVPHSLPCRDVEKGQVADFVREVLSEGMWLRCRAARAETCAACACVAAFHRNPVSMQTRLLFVAHACCASGGGKCLYVSGIPGTGKTATVLEVMRGLKRQRCALCAVQLLACDVLHRGGLRTTVF